MTEREAWWSLLWAEQVLDCSLSGNRELERDGALRVCRTFRRRDRPWPEVQNALSHVPPPPLPENVVLRCDAEYPQQLFRLSDPPLGLFVRGDVSVLKRSPAVAVVGARRARADSVDIAHRIAGGLAAHGVLVVSGLAIGIDGVAHQAALEADAPTVAVVGSGLARPYPPQNRQLAAQIAASGGVLVSEYADDVTAHRRRFPARNRIIAGLSDYIVVVQAAAKSGSLQTVDFGTQVGIDAGVVPSSVGDTAYRGSLGLLSDGARAVIDADSVCRELGIERADPEDTGLEELLSVPRRVEEIADEWGLGLDEALSRLLDLELDGAVEQVPGGLFRARAL